MGDDILGMKMGHQRLPFDFACFPHTTESTIWNFVTNFTRKKIHNFFILFIMGDGWIHEKNCRSKTSWHTPFKIDSKMFLLDLTGRARGNSEGVGRSGSGKNGPDLCIYPVHGERFS